MSDTRRGLVAGLLGALVAAVLGLLTFGVQATAGPRGLPLAIAVPEGAGPAVSAGIARLTERTGDAVVWRAVPRDEARDLLDNAEVYGVLGLRTDGPPVVVVSGAVNPSGTQVAQQILTTTGQALATALAQPNGAKAGPIEVQTLHPSTIVGRTLPLAASALLWLATLVASIAVVALAGRDGRSPSTGGRFTAAAVATVLAPAVVIGFALLWEPGISLPGPALAFLVLAAAGFALLQGAVLRLLGLRGAAVLGPLYLVAPAVSGQVPELLNPIYRVLLWSWSPFRFSTEGLRTLLAGTSAPAVGTGIAVLGGLALLGFVVLAWPARPGAVAAKPARKEPVAA